MDYKNINIDLVYTWVNSSDNDWKSIKDYHWKNINIGDNSIYRFPMTKNPCCELIISLISVQKYLDWVNNIYIVTTRPQIPDLSSSKLKKKFKDKIKIIHHDEIWKNNDYLPSFNSHSIEGNIHRIPNLSEYFLYMNDDFYFSKHIKKQNFFDKKGNIIIKGKKETPKFSKSSIIYWSSHNNLYNFDKKNYYKKWHHVAPLKKHLMYDAEIYFGKIWEDTLKNKFRSMYDIPPIDATLTYANKLGLINKDTILKTKYYQNCKSFFHDKTKKFIYHCICINNCNDIEKYENNFLRFILKNETTKKYIKKNDTKPKIEKRIIKIKFSKNPDIFTEKQKKEIQKNKKINDILLMNEKQREREITQEEKNIQKESNIIKKQIELLSSKETKNKDLFYRIQELKYKYDEINNKLGYTIKKLALTKENIHNIKKKI
jgi:hypothetical protein